MASAPLTVANLFSHIPPELEHEFFEEILGQGRVTIERIVSRGHRSPDGFWYDQKWDEWVLLVTGRAGLAFADEPALVELKPGDHILIPAGRRHRVAWTAQTGDTIWLAVHLHKL